MMTPGMANTFHTRSMTTLTAKKTYRNAFCFQVKFLNLRLISGSLETRSNDKMILITANISAFKRWFNPLKFWFNINGSPLIKKALAGVGSPINCSLCLSSVLNLASLNAENKAILNEIHGRIGLLVSSLMS